MEFGKHIGKGIWGFADKSLVALYGIGFIFLVIRYLPQKEYGAFVIIQTVLFFGMALGNALALIPLTKFAAEGDDYGKYISSSLIMSVIFYALFSIILVTLKGFLISLIDKTREGNLDILFNYFPILFYSCIIRNFAVALLQSKYMIKRIFWIDFTYYGGVLILVLCARLIGKFSSAENLIILTIISLICSSILGGILSFNLIRKIEKISIEAWKKMWGYGHYSFWNTTFYTAFSQVEVLFVSSFAGIAGAAVYSAAKIFTKIFDMFSQVAQLFLLPFSSKTYADKDIQKLTVTAEKAICFGTILLFPVFIVMFFFPQEILHILYRGKYDDGAALVRIFSFMAIVVPWIAVLPAYQAGLNRMREGFIAGVLLLVISIPFYLVLAPILGSAGVALGLVLTYLLVLFYWLYDIKKVIPLYVRNIFIHTRDTVAFANSLVAKYLK